jgi:hypothetical protein
MDKENNALLTIKALRKELNLALKECVDQPKEPVRLLTKDTKIK